MLCIINISNLSEYDPVFMESLSKSLSRIICIFKLVIETEISNFTESCLNNNNKKKKRSGF